MELAPSGVELFAGGSGGILVERFLDMVEQLQPALGTGDGKLRIATRDMALDRDARRHGHRPDRQSELRVVPNGRHRCTERAAPVRYGQRRRRANIAAAAISSPGSIGFDKCTSKPLRMARARELLAQGVEPASLILVEFNKEFVKFLKREFPNLRIVEGPAQDLPQLLKTLGQASVKKVISGIPLRSMKPKECRQIAMAVAAVLEPGGIFVQFSYFKASPVPKAVAAEAGLAAECVGFAKNNVPPAFVWQYTRSA